MKKFQDFNIFGLVAILIALIFIGINFNQCQSNVKPKYNEEDNEEQPSVTCNYNGMCEAGEYDYSREHEWQPCPDCQLKSYMPLQLVPDLGLQIVGSNNDIGKVFQFKFENWQYVDAWASKKIEKTEEDQVLFLDPDIGDVDQDGEKEIVLIVTNYYSTGQEWKYDQKILMYKNGSDGTPSYESERFGNSVVNYAILADINNDGKDELILDRYYWVEIYEWNESSFEKRWTSPEYNYFIYRIDVGDADNDGENELILAMFTIGVPIIWKFDENFNGEETVAEPIGDFEVNHARARDADNDGLNEIIAGGNNNRLMVWKYLWDESFGTYRYKFVFISEDLGGFTLGIDAGDVDGDGDNEVIVGTAVVGGSGTLYIFDLVLVDPYKYTYRLDLVDSMELDPGVGELSVGDVDNDGKAEIIVSFNSCPLGRMRVFEYIGGQLEKTYSSIYGRRLKIK